MGELKYVFNQAEHTVCFQLAICHVSAFCDVCLSAWQFGALARAMCSNLRFLYPRRVDSCDLNWVFVFCIPVKLIFLTCKC